MNKEKPAPPIAKIAPPIAFNIPANISPEDVGEYIAELAKEKYNIPLASSTTASITFVAKEATKDKMRLSKISVQLGADWLPIKANLEWEKK